MQKLDIHITKWHIITYTVLLYSQPYHISEIQTFQHKLTQTFQHKLTTTTYIKNCWVPTYKLFPSVQYKSVHAQLPWNIKEDIWESTKYHQKEHTILKITAIIVKWHFCTEDRLLWLCTTTYPAPSLIPHNGSMKVQERFPYHWSNVQSGDLCCQQYPHLVFPEKDWRKHTFVSVVLFPSIKLPVHILCSTTFSV